MRRKDREVTNTEEVLKIINKTKYLHLGIKDNVYPYIVPMHYGYTYENGKFTFYMHCAKEGYKLNLLKKDAHVSLELECEVEDVSGGDVPCRYGATFASFMGKGIAEIVEDVDEKKHGLEVLMLHQTGQHFTMTEEMTKMVTVVKVIVQEYSAKARK